jgi:hypothetical protein
VNGQLTGLAAEGASNESFATLLVQQIGTPSAAWRL